VGDEESGILEVKHLDRNNSIDVYDRIFNHDVRLLKKELIYHEITEVPFLPLPPHSRVQLEGKKKFTIG